MRVLLDTHALVWWLLGDVQLSEAARRVIETASVVYVSAASAWELSTKARLGKWPEAQGLADDLPAWVHRQGMTELAVTLDHGARAGACRAPIVTLSTECWPRNARPRRWRSSAWIRCSTPLGCDGCGSP